MTPRPPDEFRLTVGQRSARRDSNVVPMNGASAADIAADLRRQIAGGAFGPSGRVPSVRELRDTYHVAKATVHAATRMLHSEGLIVTSPGVGCFVRDNSERVQLLRRSVHESRQASGERTPLRNVLSAEATDEWFADVVTDVDIVEAGPDIANELGIDESDSVVRRSRTMAEDGTPVSLVSAYFPRAVSEGTMIEEKYTGEGGVYARLKELGRDVERHIERVTCGLATDDEMARLDLGRDQPRPPVVRIDRLTLDRDGQALGTVRITALAERFELVYEILDEMREA